MAYFTNANGERITVVTNENLPQFLEKAEIFVDEKLLQQAKEDKAFAAEFRKDYAERAEKWSALQEQRIQNIETEKQKVLARKGQLKEAAKSVRAPETSTLKAVTADMDKDTKAAIRESNKQITDTLEKPVTERIKKVRNGR